MTAENASLPRTAFVAVAPLYDELMRGVPYHDWIVYLRRLLAERGARPQRVLDLACGTGNVTEELAAEGYVVTGADLSPEMIAQARRKATEKGLAIEYFAQDAAELDLPGQRFHLCVSLFDSLNNILIPERMAQAMRRVLAHLEPGGLFIFDLNTEFALKNQFFDQDNLTSNDRLRYDWTSQYFPESRLCRIQMRFWFREEDGSERAFEETHWQYAYTKTEILKMLRAAGFQELTAYQAYTFRPPAPTSDRIFYIARRPD